MEKIVSENFYSGYTDILYNLDPENALRYGCYDLAICRKCLKLYGRIVMVITDHVTGDSKSEWHYQECSCMVDDDSKNGKTNKRWDGFDYNTAVEFCYCCSRKLINSGFKFSSFYCEECNERVKDYNNHKRYAFIPLGRHSFMNGLMLSVPYTDEQYTRFNNNLNAFFDRIDKIREWQKKCLSENLHELVPDYKKDIDLPLYDALLSKGRRSKEELFRRMVEEVERMA